jgi:hypothetical protein
VPSNRSKNRYVISSRVIIGIETSFCPCGPRITG